jgi:hypothetical protein
MNDAVVCYSGVAYADRPVRLNWKGRVFEVKRILASWRTPDGKGFCVLTDDEQTFDLFYGEQEDEWHIRKHQPE